MMYLVSDVFELEKHVELVKSIRKAKRIMVITGAGVSVAGGIPDFRSEGGLFDQIRKNPRGTIRRGQELFDAKWITGMRLVMEEQLPAKHDEGQRDEEHEEDSSEEFYFDKEKNNSAGVGEKPGTDSCTYLVEGTRSFLSFMAELKQLIDRAEPTKTHRFLKYLSERKRLLRVYTQNIDCLEEKVGLKLATHENVKLFTIHPIKLNEPSSSPGTEFDHSQPSTSECSQSLTQSSLKSEDSMVATESLEIDEECRVVLLHGSLHHVICTSCDSKTGFTGLVEETFRQGLAMLCPECELIQSVREAGGLRRRSIGILRPDIVLYNEPHPRGDWVASIFETDLKRRPDLLLIIGTSLRIPGCKHFIKRASKSVRAQKGKVIFINNLPPTSPKEWIDIFDAHLMGDCDDIVQKISDLMSRKKWNPIKKLKSCPDLGTMLVKKKKTLKRNQSDSCVEKPVPKRKQKPH
jgi:NAD-dependent SIR2 family protein deacetylase